VGPISPEPAEVLNKFRRRSTRWVSYSEDRPVSITPARIGCSIKGAIERLHQAAIQIRAASIGATEAGPDRIAAPIRFESKDDAIAKRAARVSRTIEQAVMALDDPGVRKRAVTRRVAERVKELRRRPAGRIIHSKNSPVTVRSTGIRCAIQRPIAALNQIRVRMCAASAHGREARPECISSSVSA